MWKNLLIGAFVLFVGGSLTYQLYGEFGAMNKKSITQTDEYKALWDNMVEESQPLLDSLEKLTKMEEEINVLRTQIFEHQDEEFQYEASKKITQYQRIVSTLPPIVANWQNQRDGFKNHSQMEMQQIEADFEKMSTITKTTISETNAVVKNIDQFLSEVRQMFK